MVRITSRMKIPSRRFCQRLSLVSKHQIMNNNYLDPHGLLFLIRRYHLVYTLGE